MLILLFVLSTVAFVATVIMQTMVKKNRMGETSYGVLLMIQSACIGAIFAILAVLIFKGRTLN
ncbi:hypothetical protein [Candidatus Enterococcus mansonii]|uniref:Uncharacterized protein n=1 Tax=Candidatus Enterococcus mansonii TaxID=1834181 RepID=A0A242CI47_9ENTE|nr:hypothetical protein [Enterococcus sp. 4G2_DIV0659]OTO09923.1 hypothetical protein A5880_000606 [Enterococcus sp. 4G2_DIV0659]